MASAATFAAVILVVLCGLRAAQAGSDLISRTCKRTQDAALCVAVLSADDGAPTPPACTASPTSRALDMATYAAKQNFKRVNFLDMNIDPEGDAASVCCAAYFDAAIELYLHARDSFNEADYVGASRLVASAQGVGETCEDAFKDTEPAVTRMNLQMTERCVVARGLIDLLAPSCCCCACSHKNF